MITGDASEVYGLAVRLERVAGRIGTASSGALTKTASDIVETARALAPVDTGALRDSISASVTGALGDTAVEIGPTVSYGPEVEYGTSDTSPQPFMRPAFERGTPQLEADLDRIVRGLL